MFKISLILASLIFLFTYSFTSAEIDTTKIKNYRDVNKIDRVELKEKLSGVKQERIRSNYGKMITMLEATIERLNKLALKMESNLDELKKRNEKIDVTTYVRNIAEAKVLLTSASTKVESLKGRFEDILTAEDPKLVFTEFKASFESLKDDLKKAHRLLKFTTGEVKGLSTSRTRNK